MDLIKIKTEGNQLEIRKMEELISKPNTESEQTNKLDREEVEDTNIQNNK